MPTHTELINAKGIGYLPADTLFGPLGPSGGWIDTAMQRLSPWHSGGSSASQNKLPQLILGYIYILKNLQSNFIGKILFFGNS